MGATRRAGLVCLAAVVVVLVAACSPPSGVVSSTVSLCTPTDALWDHVDITFVSVPVDSRLVYERAHEYWVDGHLDDVVVEDRTFVAGSNAVVGATVSVGAAQRGRCIHLTPSGGITYRYQPVWTTNLASYLVNEGYMGGFRS